VRKWTDPRSSTIPAWAPSRPRWRSVNSGDYNGDGNADLLWRDGTNVSLWEMDGPNILSDTHLATIPLYWHIQP
jgi:hypothetical protein